MRRALAMAAALGTACLVSIVPSAARADVPLVGEPCTMETSDQEHPGMQAGWVASGRTFGDVTAGPFAIRCSVQVGFADPNAPDSASATGPVGNPAYLPPAEVAFQAFDGQPVFLCTEYVYAGGESEYYDADPTQPGIQCERAQRTDEGTSQAYAVRNQLCVYVGTEPRTGACLPSPLTVIWTLIDSPPGG